MRSVAAVAARASRRALLSSSSSSSTARALVVAGRSSSAWPIRALHKMILPGSDVPDPNAMGLVSSTPSINTVWTKTPMEYIADVPPIEVDGTVAVCDGGDASLGHPIEYIQLNKVNPHEPSTCKYCGLRFVAQHH